ncbi:uncharacterized protein LOC143276267 isoform X2 [Babylonia areolata]
MCTASTITTSTTSTSRTRGVTASGNLSSYSLSCIPHSRRRESGLGHLRESGRGRGGGSGEKDQRVEGGRQERGFLPDLDTDRSAAQCPSSTSSKPSASLKSSASSPSSLLLLSSHTESSNPYATRRGHRLYRKRHEDDRGRGEVRETDPDLRKGKSLDTKDVALSVSDSNSLLSLDRQSGASRLSKTSTLSSLCSDQDLDLGHRSQHDFDKSSSRARRIQKSATTTLLTYPQRASFDYESTTPELSEGEEKVSKDKKGKEGKEKEKEGGKKKRFGKKMLAKTLRRSQSASYARDVPAHALFLRHRFGGKGVETFEDRLARGAAYPSDGLKEGGWGRGEGETRRSSSPRPIHKTTSADAAMMLRDEYGNIACQNKSNKKSLAKTVKRKLQSLRRRHTDSTLSTLTKEGKHSAFVDPDQAMQWSRSFESLLTDRKGVELFRGFLRSEFSEENLEFWIAVEEFKLVKPRKVTSVAFKIYSNFVEEQAPREINVDSGTRLRTLANLDTPCKSVFEEAQRKVQALMEKDSYPRFLESEIYQQIIRSSKC